MTDTTEHRATWDELTPDERMTIVEALAVPGHQWTMRARAVYEMLGNGPVIRTNTARKVQLATIELKAALEFIESCGAEMLEIKESPTGVGSRIDVTAVFMGKDGWELSDRRKDVSDYDSW